MKVNFKKWNAIAAWRWNLPEDDVCGICQNQFETTCPTCRYPGDDCGLCTSSPHFATLNQLNKCADVLHATMQCQANAATAFTWSVSTLLIYKSRTKLTWSLQHCILEWIKQDTAKGQCPMCRQSMSTSRDAKHSRHGGDTDWSPRIRVGEREEEAPCRGEH